MYLHQPNHTAGRKTLSCRRGGFNPVSEVETWLKAVCKRGWFYLLAAMTTGMERASPVTELSQHHADHRPAHLPAVISEFSLEHSLTLCLRSVCTVWGSGESWMSRTREEHSVQADCFTCFHGHERPLFRWWGSVLHMSFWGCIWAEPLCQTLQTGNTCYLYRCSHSDFYNGVSMECETSNLVYWSILCWSINVKVGKEHVAPIWSWHFWSQWGPEVCT